MPKKRNIGLALHTLGMTRLCALTLIGYFAFCFVVQQFLPWDETLMHYPFYQWGYIGVSALLLVVYAVAQETRRPKVLLQHRLYWSELFYLIFSGLVFFTFFESFGYTKSLIPSVNPYYLDPWLQRIELFVNLGFSPTHWAINAFPDWLLFGLDATYLLSWIVVVMSYFVWQLALPPSESRTVFLSSFIMIWIIAGIVAAGAFSSVGPIYYATFYQDQYSAMNAELVERLNAINTTYALKHAINVRQMLLDFYNSGTMTHFNGISSMPSLHTAMVMLLATHSVRYARWAAWLMIPFGIIIFIGSWALGWHYVIDTYVSALIVFLIWRGNVREVRRHLVHKAAATAAVATS